MGLGKMKDLDNTMGFDPLHFRSIFQVFRPERIREWNVPAREFLN